MHSFAGKLLRYFWAILLFLSCGNINDSLFERTIGQSSAVTITSPLPESTIVDTVVITASTDRSIDIRSVKFFIDGLYRHTDFQPPWSFEWDSYELADDQKHRISVTGYDSHGNAHPSRPVMVKVRYPLFGIITDPDSGSSVQGNVTVSVNAYHSRGIEVRKVEFYIDRELVFCDEKPPWFYNWDTHNITDDLNHSIRCKVYDAAGKTSLSSLAIVVVKSSLIPSTYNLTFDRNDNRIDLILINNYTGPFLNQKPWKCSREREWISVVPESGITNAGGWARLTVTVDRYGLPNVTQYGSLVISSGQQYSDTLVIPVKVYM
ncbi:MAG: hypothetical protein EH225_08935 [Calditrichaeota bacterium]|nr:MAG: hypothetical protein EH225_08935 [Calditrichota bacterium]